MRSLATLGAVALAGAALAQGMPVPQAVPQSELWPATFRAQVAQCWNVGGLPDAARQASVTLRVAFDATARPILATMQMQAATGNAAATEQLYDSARRALMRCAGAGYDLPPDQIALWRVMDLTFEPAAGRMR